MGILVEFVEKRLNFDTGEETEIIGRGWLGKIRLRDDTCLVDVESPPELAVRNPLRIERRQITHHYSGIPRPKQSSS